ncbi:MAG: malonyl-CoA decarboxylase [Burkholderiales bacterium]|nr:malonyl-CoA decarboxylase [Burkholderiales bacterium]
MSTGSFLKRIIGEIVHPSESARATRRARNVLGIARSLLSERGEVSGAALARELLAEYERLPQAAHPVFFDLLVTEFAPLAAEVAAAADAYRADPSPGNLLALQRAVEPPRQELMRRLNMAPGGTAALVGMRRLVLAGLGEHPGWKPLEADLAHLLTSWFNRGFLMLRRIDWHTPAIVLEKLIEYEAVHEITGWHDLRRRLEADRRCFAFFHPVLPDEPLIFIEVALARGMSDAVGPLLDPDAAIANPAQADTAVFYSITNCQDGLRGVSFGNLLIKQVVEELGRELPRVQRFATLSPLTGFCDWLKAARPRLERAAGGRALVAELDRLADPGWSGDEAAARTLQPLVMRLAAHYLLEGTRGGAAIDPVARFHLGNGARVERLNWLADASETGMRRSAGLMVNYVYDPADVERNHEAYAKEGRVVASHSLRALARASPLSRRPARA